MNHFEGEGDSFLSKKTSGRNDVDVVKIKHYHEYTCQPLVYSNTNYFETGSHHQPP